VVAIRYQVTGPPGAGADWPARQNGHTALAPTFTRQAACGAQEYKGAVTGQPGTKAIPVAPVVPSPDPGDIALMGLSRSSDAPNVFYPNLYYTSGPIRERPGAGMPVSVYSDNLMPVPAVDPRGIPATDYLLTAGNRGQTQIQSYPLLPRWANRGGG
jgi:hypothetical protein